MPFKLCGNKLLQKRNLIVIFRKTGGISSEEEEIRLINQRMVEARKRKEARLEAARLKEIEHLAERNRLAKERKQLEAELLAEKKLLRQKNDLKLRSKNKRA